ncbi:MAG: type I-C CRISPR-associated protein Cas8c/Csd1 [Lachnospiraceae bacterium]|nr:type I-C CRISPR-associated protein Cas8c/Csd1 [Lachnospiraceae bacterium]
MLIHALSGYYDILAKAGKVLPEGYSNVKIHYKVCLTEDGRIDEILSCKVRTEQKAAKGKIKEVWNPRNMVMPKRTEKPGIDANIIEHRPLYLFGLNCDKEILSPEDRTQKAKKSHNAFVKTNLEFLEGLDSPVIQAYRQFLQNWNPEEETQNSCLLGLGKEYDKSSYAFCLTGYPDQLLQDDVQVKKRWEEWYRQRGEEGEDAYISQCAVSGIKAPIARIHSKVKGVYGGLVTGTVLVGFNNPSENSYGKEQSYNSSISSRIMQKYTEALNYLLETRSHKILMDDMTIVFWAMNPEETCEDVLMAMLCGQSEQMNTEQTEQMLKNLLEDARKGNIIWDRLCSTDCIQPDIDFYMVGLKPNSSRLAVKFIYRKRYADILWNVAKFQEEMQVSETVRPLSIARIKMELVSPKSSHDTVNPALLTKLFEAVIHGSRYPEALLETTVRRVKTDTDKKVNEVRAGIIKACINRNYKKEELKVALDRENYTPAYLCGRLFAVLERLQQDASGNSLNRTIKDAYFASASSRPAIVFPKLLKLAQNHLNKVKGPVFYNKLIGEITWQLEGEFPETLLLTDQGRFVIGYYQQYQSFFITGYYQQYQSVFEKKDTEQKEQTEEDGDGN